MNARMSCLLALAWFAPFAARAQTGFIGGDGVSRYPGVTILCPSGTHATPCSFGGGNANGAVTINLGSSPVGLTNLFPVTDPTVDALVTGGALKVGGTVTITGAELSSPGTAGTQAVTVQGAPGALAVPVTCSGCSSANGSVANTGVSAPASATQLGLPNATGNLTAPVLNADGGLPAHVTNFPATQAVSGTFWPATQATADTAMDALISGGAFSVSAATLPLPAGAAKSAYQTNVQAPVAPSAATATNSVLLGCLSNTTLPGFTAGQQGAIPCDASGRPYVVTVPSANNVPAYLQAISSGGAYTSRAINAAASAMASVVKSSAGLVYGYEACNSGASAVFFRLFNLGVAPTVGSSTPAISKIVPAGTCQSFSTDLGLTFGTGIAFDATSGSLADSDTATIATANQVAIEVYTH
jgi:hypothetical protein